jgi:cell division protein FtsZ
VNEASSLIQNAAHEDANIIFGAVLDEKMGDEVKITVIATGFRQESPERRERMLSSVLNVHVPPVSFVRPEAAGGAPRFASEESEDTRAVEEPAIVYSVRQNRPEEFAVAVAEREAGSPEMPSFTSGFLADFARESDARGMEPILTEQKVMVASGFRPRVFGDGTDAEEQETRHEDLDVPAFMRRGEL